MIDPADPGRVGGDNETALVGIDASASTARWHNCRHRTNIAPGSFRRKPVTMKGSPTLFLQAVIVLIGIGVLALMLWEPHLEGRNAHASLFQIYFNDPFLAYAYMASIPFFVALYQAFTLLGHIGQNKVFSPNSVRALRAIKYCAISLVGFLVGAEAYFVVVRRGQDDIAGGVVLGLFMIFVSAVAAATAAVFETTLQNTFDIKSGTT